MTAQQVAATATTVNWCEISPRQDLCLCFVSKTAYTSRGGSIPSTNILQRIAKAIGRKPAVAFTGKA